MPIDLEDFIGPIVYDRIASRRTPIACDEDAALELESEDRRRLGDGNIRRGRRCSYRSYGTYMSHSSQHPDKIIGACFAPGRVHHWPVRWR
jgi:hypothetical protein